MIGDAEKKGILKSDSKIIQATSGNTGIAFAWASAARGYDLSITMPEKMSREKSDVLKGLGAKVIRTPNGCTIDHPDSHIQIANRIAKTENRIFLNQYQCPSNPLAHYDQLAEEILFQCDEKIDAVVVGAGTGGVITGIGRKFKEKFPNIQVVGVDPYGSVMAMPQTINKGGSFVYKVEGIGHDFIPRTCDRTCIDHWVKATDQ